MNQDKIRSIAEVRRRTQAPISSCRKALELSNWDVDAAVNDISLSLKGNGNGPYGTVCLFSHGWGRIGVMVELSCESGYMAKSREFAKLANTIAVHISWANPLYLDVSHIPDGADRVLSTDMCLLDQKEERESNGTKTIRQLVQEFSSRCGERISVVRFARFEVGQDGRMSP